MKCNRCGRELDEEEEYCLFCGNKLKNNYKNNERVVKEKERVIKSQKENENKDVGILEDNEDGKIVEAREEKEDEIIIESSGEKKDDGIKNTFIFAGCLLLSFLPFIVTGSIKAYKYLSATSDPSVEFFGPLPELFMAGFYILLVIIALSIPIIIIIVGSIICLIKRSVKKK